MEANTFKQQLRDSIEFFNLEGVLVKPEEHASYDDVRTLVDEDVDGAVQNAANFGISHPDWFIEADNSARAFMSALGFNALKEMVLYPENSELLESYGLTGSTVAVADPFLPYITVSYKKAEAMRDAGGPEVVGGLIVHELGHDTASALDRIIVRQRSNGAQLLYRSGFATVDPQNNARGDFLEEGFAHYLFGWYRRSQRSDYNTRVLGIDGLPELTVPEYYISQVAKTAGPDGYAIELLAWGLEQHGHMSANDFIGTLLDSRRLQTRSAALRLIAQTIDRLQPGLYMKLNRLTYSVDDWNKGLKTIHSAVTEEI